MIKIRKLFVFTLLILLIQLVITIDVNAIMITILQPAAAQSNRPEITWTQVPKERAQRIVDISLDGKRILFGNVETQMLTVYDLQTEQTMWQIPMDFSAAITSRWSPDGRQIAAIVDGNISILDAANGDHISEIESSLKKYEDLLRVLTTSEKLGYTDFKWSSDSKQLSALSHGYIIVYDISTESISTVVDLVIISSGDLREYLHKFDWSLDNSKFAAFHYKIIDNQPAFPIEIVIGFWDQNGRWLSQYEIPNSEQACIPNGQDEWRGAAVPPGGEVTWSRDNKTLLVSTNYNGYIVCKIEGNGILQTHHILDNGEDVNRFFWSFDQKWLIGISTDCSLLVFDTADNYLSHQEQFNSGHCLYDSAAWNYGGHYLAIGSELVLWIGMICPHLLDHCE